MFLVQLIDYLMIVLYYASFCFLACVFFEVNKRNYSKVIISFVVGTSPAPVYVYYWWLLDYSNNEVYVLVVATLVMLVQFALPIYTSMLVGRYMYTTSSIVVEGR